jgi:uncharacterized protein with gpF-like domain
MAEFRTVNKETLKRLRRKRWVRLPGRKKLKIPADMQWNMRFFNSQLLKGLLAGETVQQIADRIFPEIMDKTNLFGHTIKEVDDIIRRNRQAALRNARTMVTGAENAGRLDSYKTLEEQGVIQKKRWIATPDDRTRASHVEIDGEEQDINEPFSNGCMYPGDPDGELSEVINCRCSMGDRIIGFMRSDGSIAYVGGEREETLHDRQMEQEKERRRWQ